MHQFISSILTEYPNYTILILILSKIIGAILLLPGTPLTLLTGALLGIYKGFIVSMIGNSIGAIFAFLLSRYTLQEYVKKNIIDKYPKINQYEKRFFASGLKTVILLRLIPLFPFNVLNYALGVTSVRTRDYIIGTIIGIIPGTFAFVYFGESIYMLNPINIILSIIAITGLTLISKKYENK